MLITFIHSENYFTQPGYTQLKYLYTLEDKQDNLLINLSTRLMMMNF